MLFLNTLDVNAYNSPTIGVSQQFEFTLYPDNFTSVQDVTSESGSTSTSGSFSVNSVGTSGSTSDRGTYSCHGTITIANGVKYFNTDLSGEFTPYDSGLITSNFDTNQQFISCVGWGINASSDVGSVINNFVTLDGSSITNRHYVSKGTALKWGGSSYYYSPTLIYNSHFTYALPRDTNFFEPITFTVTVNFYYGLNDATAEEVASSSNPVSDVGSQAKLDTQIQQNNQAESTRSGILAKITEFFGSFFSNLIGVFVPEDGYFSDWFTRLNTLLADKLGMLYAPFDLLIQVLTSILNADDSFAGIPFPGIEWDGQYLIEPFTFTFSSLGDVYTDLQGYVYFGTDVILLLAFFGLLQDKIKHILED